MGTKINLIVDQGADFSTDIDLEDLNEDPLDVTGYTARAAMKKNFAASNAAVFSTSLDSGILRLALTASQTANLVPGRYVFDVKMVNSTNVVSRPVEGIVTVTPGVTS